MSLRMERAIRRKRQILAVRLGLLFLALLALSFFGYLIEESISAGLKEKRMQIMAVNQGNLIDSLNGKALIINQEFLIQAPQAGRFENLVGENEKVRKGQTIGCIVDKDHKLRLNAPSTGIYTAQIDGLEQVLKAPVLNAIGPEFFSYQPRVVNASTNMKAGQVVCKIIDNLRPNVLIVRIEGEDSYSDDIKAGSRLTVWVQNQKVGTALTREIRLDKPILLQIEMDNFCESLLSQRYHDVTLTMESESGSLIPASALIGDEAGKSVYSYRDGKTYVKKVQVKKIKGAQALVAGVEVNEMVIGNPAQVESKDIAG